MPVSINLSQSKREILEKALKAAKIDSVKINRNIAEFNADNYNKVVEAVNKYHQKQVGYKTKTPLNIENSYNAQELGKQLAALADHFPSNDNVIGAVVDEDDAPKLPEDFFETADAYIGETLVEKGAADAE